MSNQSFMDLKEGENENLDAQLEREHEGTQLVGEIQTIDGNCEIDHDECTADVVVRKEPDDLGSYITKGKIAQANSELYLNDTHYRELMAIATRHAGGERKRINVLTKQGEVAEIDVPLLTEDQSQMLQFLISKVISDKQPLTDGTSGGGSGGVTGIEAMLAKFSKDGDVSVATVKSGN